MLRLISAVLALALISVCAASLSSEALALEKSITCANSVEANRQTVIEFYKLALVGLKPRAGFERFASTDFIEHKPDVPEGTRAATIKFLEDLIASMPKPKWEILRTIAQGDMVFLHARFTPAEGAPSYAVADIFRMKNCRIVEHWDVVAGPPEEQRNPHSRF